MFYRNNIKTKKSISKTITFNTFSENINAKDKTVNAENSIMSYNYENQRGLLETGIGFETLALPIEDGSSQKRIIKIFNETEVRKIWHYKYYDHINKRTVNKVIFYNIDGRLSVFVLFSYDDYTYIIDKIEPFDDLPLGLNYCIEGEDFMLFFSGNGLCVYSTHRLPMFNENCPKLVAFCKIYDYLFLIPDGDRNSILYTSNLSPLALNSTLNSIDLTSNCGRLNSLINLDDYLFIFRDYGISKLSKYGSSENFSISDLYLSSTKIFGDTVIVCGNVVIFFGQGGIYSFNGSSVTKFDLNLEILLENTVNEFASACYFKGKYYLACRLNFNDDKQVGCENTEDFKNNAIIILDLESKKLNITRGVDISSLLSLNSGSLNTILATFYGEHSKKIGVLNNFGQLFGTDLNSEWRSSMLDLNQPEKIKIIKKIIIQTEYDCVVKIKSDLEEKSISIQGSNKVKVINTSIKAKSFQVIISSVGKSKISFLNLKVDIYE